MREDVIARGWDKCTSEGVFKSISVCYEAKPAPTPTYVYRYDYFVCQRWSQGFLLYRQNCTGYEEVPTADGRDVFNRYNPDTNRCDLEPPPTTTTTTTTPTTTTTATSEPPPPPVSSEPIDPDAIVWNWGPSEFQ